jgi:two-component system LytT family response regulator
VRIHAGRESHLVRETLQSLEDRLDPSKFLRIHRSTLVNLDRIQELQPLFHGDYVVKLLDGTELSLSRVYRERLAGPLGQFL